MAELNLTPKLKVCFSGCEKLVFSDITGAYEVTDNEGGWGTPNPALASVTNAVVTISSPSGTLYTLDVTSVLSGETISPEIGLGELNINAEDGDYTFNYLIEVGEDHALQVQTIFSTCVARCCVDKLWVNAINAGLSLDCKCTDSKTATAMQAEALYTAIQHAGKCPTANTRNELLTRLQRICNLTNCNCN